MVMLAAVAHAKVSYGIDLDFTPESVRLVEQILEDIHDKNGKGLWRRLLGRGLSGDAAAKLARMYGSYVGESLLRTWGGRWEKDHAVAGAGSYPIFCRGNESFPLGWCYKRLMNGPEDNVWHKVLVLYLKDQLQEVVIDVGSVEK